MSRGLLALCTAALFLLLCAAAQAQSTGILHGRVVDDLGDPLPGANVVLESTQLGAATDIDGNYWILDVPVGDYNVTASFVGFESRTVEGLRISSGYRTEQDFELGSDLSLLEIHLCCSCWWEPLISRDPFASRSMSGEEIQRLPAER